MRSRKILIDLVMILLSFLTVFCFVQNDKKLYHNQLNHNGLSENAMVYQTNSNQNVQQTLQKLAKEPWHNYQIHFNINKHVTYLYQNDFNSVLPVVSGHFFGEAAFNSEVPIVVIGQNLKDKLYIPTKQKYWKYDGNYLSVIGEIGTENKSLSVNNHVFISASPLGVYNDQPLSHFQIIADGPGLRDHSKQLQQILGATKAYHLIPHNSPIVGPTWIGTYGTLVLALTGILVVAVILGLLFLRTNLVKDSLGNLDHVMRWRRFWILLREYSFQMIVTILIGDIIGYSFLPVINISRIIVFGICALGILLGVYSAAFWWHVNKRKGNI